MKKIVVTGAKGGTGPTLVRVLRESGFSVMGIDLKPCERSDSEYRRIDIENGAETHDAFASADAIVHFGSFPGDTRDSWEKVYRNIALGGYHVLQAAANLRIPRVVLASSPMIYGDYRNVPYLPIDEDTPAAPEGIYGAAKQSLEALARSYARWHGLAIAALRPQRIVYEGAYDWRARPYNSVDSAAANALWSYVDARDVATACAAWLRSERGGFEAFNVAADDVCVPTPTRQLVKAYYPAITDVRGELAGCASLIDCRKIKAMLGWHPRYSWRDIQAEANGREPGAHPSSSHASD